MELCDGDRPVCDSITDSSQSSRRAEQIQSLALNQTLGPAHSLHRDRRTHTTSGALRVCEHVGGRQMRTSRQMMSYSHSATCARAKQ